ncbi:protein eyes shut [Maniola jurtina]|uniref:protein eyes shut n=1 Tax=Maniola jurtina TaxID=191418 RepID=UPI001E686052|nr:protein eyes shut [Maniola jurtina]
MSVERHNLRQLQCVWWMLVIVPVVSAGIACLANPCLHGICIDDLNSTYSCYCIDGYTGVQCQTNWDECWSNPCLNGGTCIDGVASYNCSCPDGFIGDSCETNYNECESNPCLNNGTCIDMTNEYVCHCIPGFSGDHCELDVAVCNSTEEVRCYNGGECIEGPGYKFYCKCLSGWEGLKCEEQIDECQSNPCRNGGICIDAHADYMCACTYGFTGKSCEVQIEFCDEDSCSNNALCVVEDGVRICYCVPDYHGERCELQYDECLLGPRCMNGGTCIDGVDNFTCSCPPRLTGTLCDCLVLDDGSYECEYVSPTYIPSYNESIITTLFTESTPIGSSMIDYTKYNTSFSTTTSITIVPENVNLTTTSDSITKTVTTAITTETAEMDLTTVKTESTTLETESPTSKIDSITTETVTEEFSRETLEADSSKTEATTECTGSCVKTNDSTIDVPPPILIPTSTEKHTTSKDITELTSPMTHEETTSIKTTASDGSTKIDAASIKTSTETTIFTDVSTTSSKDVTTDKMFTDTPVETTNSTDLVTFQVSSTETTESTDVDATTQAFPTFQSECTNSFCNNHGTCINTLHGIRCQCAFNYGGRFCEQKIIINSAAFDGNSYISHHVRNSTSINIGFNAKTLITDGQIMHVDIADGAYMKLYMESGLLKFEFSCGYQTMLLSELKTYVNKGYLMNIETRLDLYLKEKHCNGTLRLNDTVAMSGGQVANISSLDNSTVLYFGNIPNSNATYSKPFVGCIKDLVVNGEKREVFDDAFDAAEVTECSSLSCLSSPCMNGGTCSDHGDTYTCACANGWMGDHCNQSVCNHNPCHSGGSCVRHPGSGFLCLCPYGKHGIFCEYNVEITRPSLAPITTGKSSYVMYPLSSAAMNSDRFDLRLRFQTADMDQISLLAFVGQSGRHDPRSQHMALAFVKGYIMLTWNMGSGPRRIFTSRAVGPRRGGHTVRVWRRGRTAGLLIDGRHNVTGNAPAHRSNMTLLPYIFIGGHPSEDFRDLPHDLPLHTGWRGCIWEVGGQAIGTGKAVGGRGVGQCGVAQCTAKSCNAPRGVCIHSPATYGCICNEGWFGATCASIQSPCDRARTRCRGACVISLDEAQCDCPYGKTGLYCDQDLLPIDFLFSGTRSYLKLGPRSISSVSLSFEAEIKPTKERGIVIFVQTPHFYTALSLQGGLLEYRWTDHLSGLTSLVRSGVVLSMSQWHSVKCGRYGNRLYVWVDGSLSTEPMLAHAYPHTASDASIAIGGARDLAVLPFDVMSGPPESYSGCFRNFHVNNILLPLEEQNIEEGQNVGACEGAAACSGTNIGSSGLRCRRSACRPNQCAAGRCYRGRCICPSGRTGLQCEQHINITIPQFDGEAMMSLSRVVPGRNEQRLSSAPSRPSYLALNFTTADPNGLLFWINMGSDFLGLGLDKGYLKLTWSLHCNNSTKQKAEYFPPPPKLLSSLGQAGFMADGEWHSIVLSLDSNVDLVIDGRSYIEEQCYGEKDYEDLDLYVGGVTEEDFVARKMFPQNFKGCIDKISTRHNTFLSNYTEVYSENVRSCQLFPTLYTV